MMWIYVSISKTSWKKGITGFLCFDVKYFEIHAMVFHNVDFPRTLWQTHILTNLQIFLIFRINLEILFLYLCKLLAKIYFD